jgi:hypothetical protein
MYNYTVRIDGWSVLVRSSKSVFENIENLKKNRGFLDLEILPDHFPSPYTLSYDESENISVVYRKKKAFISAPSRLINDGEVLLYAIFPFIEAQRQDKGFFTIHGAAVSLNGKGILLLGKEGSGKTTTILRMCRDYQALLLGNDLVIIGIENSKISITNGTKFFHLRYESIKRNLPELLHLFPEPEQDNMCSWIRKMFLEPHECGIKSCSEKVYLNAAFVVHVDETKKDLYVSSADTLVNRLYLNENFSRYIRGSCLSLLTKEGYLGYIPSFDSKSRFTKRKKVIVDLFENHKIRFVSGPLEKVADYIISQN